MPETVLTIDEAAKYLRVSTRTIRRLMQADELRGFMIGNR